jgi:hypothetical protein
VEVRTWIDAPPERILPLVSDPVAMPRLCDELAAVGARFCGYSSHASLDVPAAMPGAAVVAVLLLVRRGG